MDETIASFVATALSLTLGTDVVIDEQAAGERDCIIVHTLADTSNFAGLLVYDVNVIICNTSLNVASGYASTLRSAFDAYRGICGTAWGVIGSVIARYEGTDTMNRAVYSVACKIGKQEV